MNIQIKLPLLFLCLTIICYVNAQDAPVENYLQRVGAYTEIYTGKMEASYNTLQYKNLPYYLNADFTNATVVYKKNNYPNQKARLDLYKEQLILMSPGKQYPIIVCSSDVEKVYMYAKTFVWMDPSKESGLKAGYYIRLSEGEKMQLFCKEKYVLRQEVSLDGSFYYFERNTRYYLLYNDQYHTVKNKNSFFKLFPQYKKQINKFVKDHKLDFKLQADVSLSSLVNYCEELLTSTSKK